MAINLRWVGEDELDRVAQTRLRCYSPAVKEREKFEDGIRADARAKPGDFLLAESGDEPVGTAWRMSAPFAPHDVAVALVAAARKGSRRSSCRRHWPRRGSGSRWSVR